MIHKTPTVNMSREEWLQERKKSLGGSDVGAILGLNEYRSPYSVWADKLGIIPDQPDNEAMRIGRDLEPYVLSRFSEASGKKTHHINAILRNDKYPHIHANVDSVVTGEKSGVEAKTVSALGAKKYRDGEFPASYYAQCVAYLAVTEYDRWYLAALIMGKDFKIYQLTRFKNDLKPDWCESSVYVPQSEIDALALAAYEFWKHVERKTPPEADGSASTTEAVHALYPDSDDETVSLEPVNDYIRTYLFLQKEEKDISKRLEEAANHIKAYMGESGRGETKLASVTWKSYDRSSFDAKAFAADNPKADLTKYYKTTSLRRFTVKALEERN